MPIELKDSFMPRSPKIPRSEAESRISKVFDDARMLGPQRVEDKTGVFEIVFKPRKQSLEELFSKPGPVTGD